MAVHDIDSIAFYWSYLSFLLVLSCFRLVLLATRYSPRPLPTVILLRLVLPTGHPDREVLAIVLRRDPLGDLKDAVGALLDCQVCGVGAEIRLHPLCSDQHFMSSIMDLRKETYARAECHDCKALSFKSFRVLHCQHVEGGLGDLVCWRRLVLEEGGHGH